MSHVKVSCGGAWLKSWGPNARVTVIVYGALSLCYDWVMSHVNGSCHRAWLESWHVERVGPSHGTSQLEPNSSVVNESCECVTTRNVEPFWKTRSFGSCWYLRINNVVQKNTLQHFQTIKSNHSTSPSSKNLVVVFFFKIPLYWVLYRLDKVLTACRALRLLRARVTVRIASHVTHALVSFRQVGHGSHGTQVGLGSWLFRILTSQLYGVFEYSIEYEVALVSRIDKIIGLFCKKRLIKETIFCKRDQ